MAETQLNPHNELKVPVYDAIAQRILDTPLIIRNAILAHLFAPEDLRSLLVVKLSEPDPTTERLKMASNAIWHLVPARIITLAMLVLPARSVTCLPQNPTQPVATVPCWQVIV